MKPNKKSKEKPGEEAEPVQHGSRWVRERARKASAMGMEVVAGMTDGERETIEKVMMACREWTARYVVLIGELDQIRAGGSLRAMEAGSGVVAKNWKEEWGVITAAHVLRKRGNDRYAGSVGIIAVQNEEGVGETEVVEWMGKWRTIGFENKEETGPDLAWIPLNDVQAHILRKEGKLAHAVGLSQLAEEDDQETNEEGWLVSVITGATADTSDVITKHRGIAGTVSIGAKVVQTSIYHDGRRGGYDYVVAPVEKTNNAIDTRWMGTMPEETKVELDERDEGEVSRRIWGGISGAGMWNLRVKADADGQPTNVAVGTLAGICYYADGNRGVLVGHGIDSITKLIN